MRLTRLLTKKQVRAIHEFKSGEIATDKALQYWAREVAHYYLPGSTIEDFIFINKIRINDSKYTEREGCSFELWDKKFQALRTCGVLPTRKVARGKYVCESHDSGFL